MRSSCRLNASFPDPVKKRWLVYEDRVSRQPLSGVQLLMIEEAHWLERCGIVGVQPQRFGMDLPALDPSGAALSAASGLGRAARGMQVDLEVELLYNSAVLRY